jgi:hypothetical protein
VALSLGIVGLPNVGKSTVFNALTRAGVLAANYPFATIEPNVGVVGVPDDRLRVLAGLFSSARIVPATVSFTDIAGIVRGASEGQGLGNRFLAHIREADAICQVVRAFDDPDVTHVDGRVDPASDIATVNTELILADLQTLDARLLDRGEPLYGAAGLAPELLSDLHLLTAKPFLYVVNIDEGGLEDPAAAHAVADLVAPAETVILCAKLEADLVELDEEEARELLASVGQQESGLARLARAGFAALGLATFLTAGPKEARAWTIGRGATAPEAAGVIHSDFQRGFIKAEVVSYADLVAAGSLAAARAAGRVRMEGKDYVMADGDVVEFRFNT